MLWVAIDKYAEKHNIKLPEIKINSNALASTKDYLNSFTNTLEDLFLLDPVVYNSISMSVKMLLCIALLVFVRGGIPRYRFDYLTKIGWVKILSIVLSIFITTALMIYLF